MLQCGQGFGRAVAELEAAELQLHELREACGEVGSASSLQGLQYGGAAIQHQVRHVQQVFQAAEL